MSASRCRYGFVHSYLGEICVYCERDELRAALREAQRTAYILAHAYRHDNQPPDNVVAERDALAAEVTTKTNQAQISNRRLDAALAALEKIAAWPKHDVREPANSMADAALAALATDAKDPTP
jgi:hypothetical protein